MGSLFRSVEMCRVQLFLQTESAYNCVSELGELDLAMFRDLNPNVNAFQRKFVNEVRRCEDMERKLRYLKHEIEKDDVKILEVFEPPDAPPAREMIDLEATFEKLDSELREVTTNQDTLQKNFHELTELKFVIQKVQQFFSEHEDRLAVRNLHNEPPQRGQANAHIELTDVEIGNGGGDFPRDTTDLSYIAAVVPRERAAGFERMLWRACRGNVFLKLMEIGEALEDPRTGLPVSKLVALVFFQGEQLKTRVKKICEGYRATIYHCPETLQQRREVVAGVATRLDDLRTILGQTRTHRQRLLEAAAKNISIWLMKLWKLKAIYHTLNLFNLDVTQKCLIAECWMPVDKLETVQMALKRGTDISGSNIASIVHRMESDESPPTYYRLNKFTSAFQGLVDAYGTSTYREVNPGPYTIITFPFLFAIMFGDVGHGIIMAVFALFLVLKEKTLERKGGDNEIFRIFFGGRYLILLMGLFSIYTGLIYNELFAKSFNIFGSTWRVNIEDDYLNRTELIMLDPNSTARIGDSVYPFGMDPIWNMAENKLIFLNGFKMKMSIVLGVTQMFFGVCLSILNYTYRRSKLEIYGVFVPQILFLSCIFVYLCALIIFKWVYFGTTQKQMAGDFYPGPRCAPSLLIGLINMFMFASQPHGFEEAAKNGLECSLVFFYPGQQYVQAIFVVVAVICIPWMLLVKPLVLNSRHKKKMRLLTTIHHDEPRIIKRGQENAAYEEFHDDVHTTGPEDVPSTPTVSLAPDGSPSAPNSSSGHGGHGHDGPFNFGDVFIYSAIHTIEFCLGCVSHTASYLRLWALSLAHAQLSEVLWNMILRMGYNMMNNFGGAITAYVIFWPFLVLTVGILVMMEGLSAFLHALRLHWVEFNSKFFEGAGEQFIPFSFKAILSESKASLKST